MSTTYQSKLAKMLQLLCEIRDDKSLEKIVPDSILLEDGGYYAHDLDPRV